MQSVAVRQLPLIQLMRFEEASQCADELLRELFCQ